MWQSIKNIYHLLVAMAACIWYGFPARKLTVIGVTGTDGKTTTTTIIHHILQNAGYNASMITTVSAVIDGKVYDTGFHVTTPSAFSVQKFLYKASKTSAQKGKRYMVLEVTSHALDQHRVFGIDFEASVITNVTHEHLDYHKTYDRYVKTKFKLLKNAKKAAVINQDDESYKIISKFKVKSAKVITYGMTEKSEINPKSFPFKTHLIGAFNEYNCLAAAGICKALGIPDTVIRKGLATVQAPKGREEIVYAKDFTVMVDFAHTPNSIEQLLSSLHKDTKGRLIHVFGSAGQRDFTKRPHMGIASSKYADSIILTSEDPRDESVEKISQEIMKGIKNSQKREKEGSLLKIADRQEAINLAIKMARKGDMVIITGKGHEGSMNFGKGEELWSDHDAVQKALDLRFKN